MGKIKLLLGASLALGFCHYDNSLPIKNKISKLENITLSDNKNDRFARNVIYECFNKACEIEYEKETEGDHWQTLSEIEKRRKGDCEDMALYLSYLLDKNRVKNNLIIGYMDSNNRLKKLDCLHCWVYVKIDNEWNILDPSVKLIIPVNGVRGRYESLGDSYPLREKLLAFKKTYDNSFANLPID